MLVWINKNLDWIADCTISHTQALDDSYCYYISNTCIFLSIPAATTFALTIVIPCLDYRYLLQSVLPLPVIHTTVYYYYYYQNHLPLSTFLPSLPPQFLLCFLSPFSSSDLPTSHLLSLICSLSLSPYMPVSYPTLIKTTLQNILFPRDLSTLIDQIQWIYCILYLKSSTVRSWFCKTYSLSVILTHASRVSEVNGTYCVRAIDNNQGLQNWAPNLDLQHTYLYMSELHYLC